jgi:hypothetical protein
MEKNVAQALACPKVKPKYYGSKTSYWDQKTLNLAEPHPQWWQFFFQGGHDNKHQQAKACCPDKLKLVVR